MTRQRDQQDQRQRHGKVYVDLRCIALRKPDRERVGGSSGELNSCCVDHCQPLESFKDRHRRRVACLLTTAKCTLSLQTT